MLNSWYPDLDQLPVQSISVLTSLCLEGQGLLITDCQASDSVQGKSSQPCGGGVCAKACR